MSDRKYGRKTGGRFADGNPGRPQGVRNKVTLAVEAILEGEAESLTRRAVELALDGDSTALRLCMERIAPPRRGRPVVFNMPDVTTTQDVLAALGAVLQAAAGGVLTPDEATAIAGLIELKRRAIETVEIEARIAALEAKDAEQGRRP